MATKRGRKRKAGRSLSQFGSWKVRLFEKEARDGYVRNAFSVSHWPQQGDRAGTLKRAMATKYSASSMSQKRIEEDKVPLECRPPNWQPKNFRPSQREIRQQEAAECVGAFQPELQDPPEHVVVHDDSLVRTCDQV